MSIFGQKQSEPSGSNHRELQKAIASHSGRVWACSVSVNVTDGILPLKRGREKVCEGIDIVSARLEANNSSHSLKKNIFRLSRVSP